MPQLINRLDALKVRRAVRPGYYADGAGLYLQVAGGGSRSWIFRFTLNGRTRDGPWLCRYVQPRGGPPGGLGGADPIERRNAQ